MKRIRVYKSKHGYFFTHPSWGNMGLIVNNRPDDPQGISQFCEYTPGPHLGGKISFQKVPEHIRSHVERRFKNERVSYRK